MKSTTLIVAATAASVQGFAFVPSANTRASTALQMGLFDGVKEAFGAEGMGTLDEERETPIDRWMGWNAKPSSDAPQAINSKGKSAYTYIFLCCQMKYLLIWNVDKFHLLPLSLRSEL